MTHEPLSPSSQTGNATTPELNDTQLLLLDTLIYRIDREATVLPGEDVDCLVRDLDTGLKQRMARENAKMDALVGEQMTFAQWFAVIDAIRRDPSLCRLRVDAYHADDRGAKMACFSAAPAPSTPTGGAGAPPTLPSLPNNVAKGTPGHSAGKPSARAAANNSETYGYVIFAGTGPGEWPDNCAGAYLADSEQQLRALNWFEEAVVPRGYAHVVASGHSKGGNKAMYLAIQEPETLDGAVSFDGQGFSRQFKAAYATAIDAHAGKIRAYALDNDFVNGLLNPISLPENRLFLKGAHADIPFAYHAPYSLLTPRPSDPNRLMLRPRDEQAQLGQLSVAFTDYMQSETDAHDFRHVCDFLGSLLECTTRSTWADAERRQRLVDLSQSPDLNLTAAYLADFLKRMGKNVTTRDIRLVLLGGGSEDALDAQTLAALAMAKLPAPLQDLFDSNRKDAQ